MDASLTASKSSQPLIISSQKNPIKASGRKLSSALEYIDKTEKVEQSFREDQKPAVSKFENNKMPKDMLKKVPARRLRKARVQEQPKPGQKVPSEDPCQRALNMIKEIEQLSMKEEQEFQKLNINIGKSKKGKKRDSSLDSEDSLI